jgi:tetratricopeptide (TPR) repeat protein
MRSSGLALTLSLCAIGACVPHKPPTSNPESNVQPRLAAADALVRVGCLDCLLEAYREYDTLRGVPPVADAATFAAIRVAGLIVLRERELGTIDEGYLTHAADLLAAAPSPFPALSQLLDIVGVLPPGPAGMTRLLANDIQVAAMLRFSRNRMEWTTWLRDRAAQDEFFAYAWLTVACGGSTGVGQASADELRPWLGLMRDAPLMAFKQASCFGTKPESLQALLDDQPRFVEIHYLLGLSALARRPEPDFDEAEAHFRTAYEWRPEWPALTLARANLALTQEDFPSSLDFYDRTLALVPNHPDALVGKVRSLTYLSRHTEAIAVTDLLLAAGWNLGDARYWRALNEAQLGHNDEAWTDIELAATLMVNAEVPKLAGNIAVRRGQLDVARRTFEEARGRNPGDCETGFYLQSVLAEQGSWSRTAEVSTEAASCLEGAEAQLRKEIEEFRASTMPAQRQARQIGKRQQEIDSGARMRATCWFNAAVASFNLARPADVRRYADKVAADEQFGDRARELLTRLPK